MTKTLSPNSSEINPRLVTDEEVAKALQECNYPGTAEECMRNVLTDFLNNRPELKLRPIAEMSEKPPEGCRRVYIGTRNHNNELWPSPVRGPDDTHAVDIQLLASEDEVKSVSGWSIKVPKSSGLYWLYNASAPIRGRTMLLVQLQWTHHPVTAYTSQMIKEFAVSREIDPNIKAGLWWRPLSHPEPPTPGAEQ